MRTGTIIGGRSATEEQARPVQPPGYWHGDEHGTVPGGPLYFPAPPYSHDDGTGYGYRSHGRPGHGHRPSGHDAGYGRSVDGTYGGYGHTHDGEPAYRRSYVVPHAVAPHDHDAAHGFYETYPQTGYDTYGPRPYGHGRIGPYRFEVYEGD